MAFKKAVPAAGKRNSDSTGKDFNLCRDYTDMEEQIMRVYNIWPSFPSISISGSACALNCRHCNGVYLKFMEGHIRPEGFLAAAKEHMKKGARGFLISGGCDLDGKMLNLPEFLPAIKELHDTGAVIKLHTGFTDEKLAAEIADSVDIASMEAVGDSETIREIFHLKCGVEKYIETFRNLKKAGVKYIAPHIAAGLHYGQLKGEFAALEYLEEIRPSTISIIVFSPTKGTEMENTPAPSPEAVGAVVKRARNLFPKTHIILGALRPRGPSTGVNQEERIAMEIAALDAGISGIEMPSTALVREAKNRGFKIKHVEAYGVLPLEYEKRVKSYLESEK